MKELQTTYENVREVVAKHQVSSPFASCCMLLAIYMSLPPPVFTLTHALCLYVHTWSSLSLCTCRVCVYAYVPCTYPWMCVCVYSVWGWMGCRSCDRNRDHDSPLQTAVAGEERERGGGGQQFYSHAKHFLEFLEGLRGFPCHICCASTGVVVDAVTQRKVEKIKKELKLPSSDPRMQGAKT